MGRLVDGVWHGEEDFPTDKGGRYARPDSVLRHWVTPDGAPGPTGEGGFKAEPGRYHLYIARACPWAHRTMVFRALKGLEGMIDISVTNWLMVEEGWTFHPGPGVIPDPNAGVTRMHELYTASDPHYSGRVTVPVLWDKQTKRIVNNESADILRMFNSAFDGVGATPGDYYPAELRAEIDALNDRIYRTVNNGVYRCGFAVTQSAYEEALAPLFETLDFLEACLSGQPYLLGERQTEADWRLWTTLLRFDLVYVGHFKCNLRRLIDYPNLWAYTRRLYQTPGIAETVDVFHIKHHYYESHRGINPRGIVPSGPVVDFTAPVV
ncbi:glutathione-dependent reductase [Azorhizobium oxalatiphilum]|uniref:Glutathione-dependent reductase n=1 Tax=Azorhizobium oxalatiphilum TaxID=980631 RepID=A0A917F322_9HYPH|nr:glutathione S-transferase family protein [Azorhizobium oxalatiphilum]GGF45931.1 glutathione-dependent reductase [Azorhizobium oxalatiphilum]